MITFLNPALRSPILTSVSRTLAMGRGSPCFDDRAGLCTSRWDLMQQKTGCNRKRAVPARIPVGPYRVHPFLQEYAEGFRHIRCRAGPTRTRFFQVFRKAGGDLETALDDRTRETCGGRPDVRDDDMPAAPSS